MKLLNGIRAFVDAFGEQKICSGWIVRNNENFPRLTPVMF